MKEEGLRGWGIMICVLLAVGVFVGSLVMIANPRLGPWGWIGVAINASALVTMWKSVEKIGRK